MMDPSIYAVRRQHLMERLEQPILLMGNGHRPRNLPMSPLPFRQDSTFLYFTGCIQPGAAILLAEGESTLFLCPPADDDALWHGHSDSIFDTAVRLGFELVAPISALEQHVSATAGPILSLAVPDLSQTQKASALSGLDLAFQPPCGPLPLVDAVIALRRNLGAEEVDEMRRTARVTEAAHVAAITATRAGGHEREIAALFNAVVATAGLTNAYPSIVTVRGEVLHNFNHVNPLEAGQLLLLDGGAESPNGYATDVTRTWPVSGTFTPRQRAAYDAVLEAQLGAIDKCRPGVRYREVHDTASRILARFLRDEGLILCDEQTSIERGAHAVFFPHGVGHLIGLDVHDLEAFGDRAAYAPDRSRSTQFGTGYLRLDLDLSPNTAVTVEPGFYVVPAILDDPKLRDELGDVVAFDRAREWIGFGGIRIEDDILVTVGDPEVLTGRIPKDPDQLEDMVGTNPLPAAPSAGG